MIQHLNWKLSTSLKVLVLLRSNQVCCFNLVYFGFSYSPDIFNFQKSDCLLNRIPTERRRAVESVFPEQFHLCQEHVMNVQYDTKTKMVSNLRCTFIQCVPRKGFGSSDCDTIYTIYFSICTQSADPNPFRGTLDDSKTSYILLFGGLPIEGSSIFQSTENRFSFSERNCLADPSLETLWRRQWEPWRNPWRDTIHNMHIHFFFTLLKSVLCG